MPQEKPVRETNLAEVFAQSRSNEKQIEELRETQGKQFSELWKELSGVRDSMTQGFRDLADRISGAGRPNVQNQLGLATVILTIVGLIGGPLGFFFYKTIDVQQAHFQRAVDSLDVKLQKEFQLSIETAKQGLENLNSISHDRRDEARNETALAIAAAKELAQKNIERIVRLELWEESRIKSDLDELRLRRMQSEKLK